MGVDDIIRTEFVERLGIAREHGPIAPILKSFDFVDHSVVFRHVVEPRLAIGRISYDQIANANAPRQKGRSDHIVCTTASKQVQSAWGDSRKRRLGCEAAAPAQL